VGLLLRTLPAHALYSAAGVAHYVMKGRARAALGGKVAAMLALPRVLQKRREIQRARRVAPSALEAVMDRRWWSIKRSEKSAVGDD
jgi:hypothetical protein